MPPPLEPSKHVEPNDGNDELGRSPQPERRDRPRIEVSQIDAKPLREWLIYAVVIGIIFAVLGGKLIITALLTDKTGLCVTILILFLAALVKNIRDILYIDHQVHLTNQQISHLVDLNDVTTFLSANDPSLFREHVKGLYEMCRRDSEVNQDNLVVLLQSRLHARTRLTDVCSRLLVTLGLIGTIIGLIAAASGLGLVMDSVRADKNKLLSGLQGAFGGMGTAFFTTLLGALFGSVALRLLGNVVDSHADNLVAGIAELAEVYIAPTLRRAAKSRIDRGNRDVRGEVAQ